MIVSISGEGNGTPLQYSCLENPMGGGAWWAAVSGVAQSQTRLKRFSSSSSVNKNSKAKFVLDDPSVNNWEVYIWAKGFYKSKESINLNCFLNFPITFLGKSCCTLGPEILMARYLKYLWSFCLCQHNVAKRKLPLDKGEMSHSSVALELQSCVTFVKHSLDSHPLCPYSISTLIEPETSSRPSVLPWNTKTRNPKPPYLVG